MYTHINTKAMSYDNADGESIKTSWLYCSRCEFLYLMANTADIACVVQLSQDVCSAT